ncbi:hypothetical protein PGTUg99_018842 [Puccinia graminis f. sp. tritici]|uniref:Uncharacterized protein n=1 Tax=Puccinia graminis f. sp. tritici TaxID=56615 RepID=A0A5B0RJB0_PUCGR|nr:hypothetical protein PGTUg99_018842 [Puccinia graminis f. sp. tritici]
MLAGDNFSTDAPSSNDSPNTAAGPSEGPPTRTNPQEDAIMKQRRYRIAKSMWEQYVIHKSLVGGN